MVDKRNKTTLLETIGVLLPFYHNYENLREKHVLSLVDNVAVSWAWKNGRSRTDPYTSVIITAIHVIASSLPCRLYIEHLPRVSTMSAIYADTLSRKDSKGMFLLNSFSEDEIVQGWPPSLLRWMQCPTLDWSLGSKILHDCVTR